jgi:hypothetical protein
MRLDEAEPPCCRSNAMEYNRTTRVPKEGLIPSHFHFEENLIPYRYASSRLTDTHPKCIISVENPAQAAGRIQFNELRRKRAAPRAEVHGGAAFDL